MKETGLLFWLYIYVELIFSNVILAGVVGIGEMRVDNFI